MADQKISDLSIINDFESGDYLTTISDPGSGFVNYKIGYSDFTTAIASGIDHDLLADLQGGTTGEAYHLTQAQHSSVTSVSSSEYAQIANIDSSTISSTQWGYVGNLDQNLNTGSAPHFANMRLTGGALSFRETGEPSAITNYGIIYTKTDQNLYYKDGTGVEHTVDLDGQPGVVQHNNLNGLQGGDGDDQYYHLDLSQYNNLTDQDAELAVLGSPTFATLNISTIVENVEDDGVLFNDTNIRVEKDIPEIKVKSTSTTAVARYQLDNPTGLRFWRLQMGMQNDAYEDYSFKLLSQWDDGLNIRHVFYNQGGLYVNPQNTLDKQDFWHLYSYNDNDCIITLQKSADVGSSGIRLRDKVFDENSSSWWTIYAGESNNHLQIVKTLAGGTRLQTAFFHSNGNLALAALATPVPDASMPTSTWTLYSEQSFADEKLRLKFKDSNDTFKTGELKFYENTLESNTNVTSTQAQNVDRIYATGAITVTLPTAEERINNRGGYEIVIVKDDKGNTVTVDRSGTDLINGVTSYTMNNGDFETVTLIPIKTGVWVVKNSNP